MADSTDSTTSRVSYTLASTLESVGRAETEAEAWAQRAGLDEDTACSVAIATREAAINAVLHGNAYDTAKQITVSYEITAEALAIRVGDQGAGLDPATVPDPLAPENILRGSGRGIFLMRAFVDEVHFRQLDPGTEITLIKHRSAAPVSTKETQG